MENEPNDTLITGFPRDQPVPIAQRNLTVHITDIYFASYLRSLEIPHEPQKIPDKRGVSFNFLPFSQELALAYFQDRIVFTCEIDGQKYHTTPRKLFLAFQELCKISRIVREVEG